VTVEEVIRENSMKGKHNVILYERINAIFDPPVVHVEKPSRAKKINLPVVDYMEPLSI
jgi:hypothetical protein